MKLFRDHHSPWLIHTKAALFAVVGALSAALLLIELPTIKTAALLAITVWACCRVYYCLFYVLDRYLGREKRFAGIVDALRFLLLQRGQTPLRATSPSPLPPPPR